MVLWYCYSTQEVSTVAILTVNKDNNEPEEDFLLINFLCGQKLFVLLANMKKEHSILSWLLGQWDSRKKNFETD